MTINLNIIDFAAGLSFIISIYLVWSGAHECENDKVSIQTIGLLILLSFWLGVTFIRLIYILK